MTYTTLGSDGFRVRVIGCPEASDYITSARPKTEYGLDYLTLTLGMDDYGEVWEFFQEAMLNNTNVRIELDVIDKEGIIKFTMEFHPNLRVVKTSGPYFNHGSFDFPLQYTVKFAQ